MGAWPSGDVGPAVAGTTLVAVPLPVVVIDPSRHFLSCDWGTSTFRLRLVEAGDLHVLAQVTDHNGIAGTFAGWKAQGADPRQRWDFYLDVVRRAIADLERSAAYPLSCVPMVISGMASSSIGMREQPYRELPIAGDGSDLVVERFSPTRDFPHPVVTVSGVRTDDDVMRGEETQLIGALRGTPVLADLRRFVFPGTHSKHVTVQGFQAVGLRTFMTGEFFDVLSRHSILTQSIEPGGALHLPESVRAFEEGVRASASGDLLHACFLVRTRSVLARVPGHLNFHFLSGLLIGAELRAIDLQRERVILVGSGPLAESYRQAFRVLGSTTGVWVEDADQCLIRGQFVIAQRMGLFGWKATRETGVSSAV